MAGKSVNRYDEWNQVEFVERELNNNGINIKFHDVKKMDDAILVVFQYKNNVFTHKINGDFEAIMAYKMIPYMSKFIKLYNKCNVTIPSVTVNDIRFEMDYHHISLFSDPLVKDNGFDAITRIEGFDLNNKRIFSMTYKETYIQLKKQTEYLYIGQDDFNIGKNYSNVKLRHAFKMLFENAQLIAD